MWNTTSVEAAGWRAWLPSPVADHVAWLATPHGGEDMWEGGGLRIFAVNWAVQFVASWVAFAIYMVWDYLNYASGALESAKLPSRHPLKPFWRSQLHMIPLVLYNQCVVWPLVFLLLVWPQWAMNEKPVAAWTWPVMLPALAAMMLVSDQMWYWGHRLMHTPYAWKHWHKMHHIAEQTAISATYVHPIEYALFTISMNLPYALTGFPMIVHSFPMGWGMFTGSGAHSGYSGAFANGDEHNAHHLYHACNFGLLMVADRMYGTSWVPGDPPPRVWSEAIKIWDAFPAVHGTMDVSTRVEHDAAGHAVAPKAAHARIAVAGDVDDELDRKYTAKILAEEAHAKKVA